MSEKKLSPSRAVKRGENAIDHKGVDCRQDREKKREKTHRSSCRHKKNKNLQWKERHRLGITVHHERQTEGTERPSGAVKRKMRKGKNKPGRSEGSSRGDKKQGAGPVRPRQGAPSKRKPHEMDSRSVSNKGSEGERTLWLLEKKVQEWETEVGKLWQREGGEKEKKLP